MRTVRVMLVRSKRALALGLCVLGLVLGAAVQGQAQIIRGGYEWITVGQPYVRLATWQDGMYRVGGNLIIGVDARFANVPVGQIKLLHRGQQVPIYISAGSDATRFDADDVIEFYGVREDGLQDSLMYRNPFMGGVHDPNGLPNRRRAIVNDTAAFFVTFDGSLGLRFSAHVTSTPPVISPEQSFRHEAYLDFYEDYNDGGSSSTDYLTSLNAEYTPGEGWATGIFGSGAVRLNTIATPHQRPMAGPPQLRARIFGATGEPHVSRVQVGSTTQDFTHSGINIGTYTLNLQPTDLSTSTTVRISPQGTGLDQQRLVWLTLTYDRLFRFDGERQFILHRWSNPTGTERTLRFEGLDFTPTDSGYVFDLSTNQRISGLVRLSTSAPARDTLLVRVPPDMPGNRRLVVTSTSGFISLQPRHVRGANVGGSWRADQGAEVVIIGLDAGDEFVTASQAYADYRRTAPGNAASVKLVFLSQILDEYGYGANSPVVIKRFIRSAWENWTVKPRHVFILFKSWGMTIFNLRFEAQLPVTWGYPASDWQLVSNFDLTQRDNTPIVSIGRLCAFGGFMITDYLDKVRETESAPYEEWRKQVVHLGGGTTLSEQNSIRGSLQGQMEPIVEGPPLAATVYYHQKSSSDIIGPGAQLSRLMPQGISLLTFFGHSTSNLFDIDIQGPSSYNNAGRYPVMIANGCFGGNFARTGQSFGEQYMTARGRGALAYIAMSGPGRVPDLGRFNERIYRIAFRDSVGQRLGDGMRQAVQRFTSEQPFNITALNHAWQFNIQGDPSIRFNFPRQPDLVVNPGSIRLASSEVTSLSDSFEVQVLVRNRGLVSTDSFDVTLQHTVVNTGRQVSFPAQRMRVALTSDSIRFMVRRGGQDFSGINRFTATVDAAGAIAEIDEMNNTATSEDIELASDRPVLLFPAPFALLNQDTLSLFAARVSLALPGTMNYLFEIDTVPTFNSALPAAQRQSPPVSGTALGARWRVPFTLSNGQVYYWRARLATAPANRWTTGSFRYVAGPEVGWQQSRLAQLTQNATTNLLVDTLRQRFDFAPVEASMRLDIFNGFAKAFFVGGSRISEQGFAESFAGNTFLLVLDGRNGRIKTAFDPFWGLLESFQPVSGFSALNARLATIADGDIVVVFAWRGNPGIDFSLPLYDAYFAALSTIGVGTALRSQPVQQTYVFVGRKGAAVGTAQEQYGGFFVFETTVTFAGPSGTMRSAPIGPATNWGSVSWTTTPREVPDRDQNSLQLYGIRADGTDSLVATLGPGSTPLTGLDARRFARVRLELSLRDDTSRTPAALNQLKVVYTPPPDLAWDVNQNYVFESEQIQEAVEGRMQITARNLAFTPVTDSIWAELSAVLANGNRVLLNRRRVPPLPASGQAVVNFAVPTIGLDGPVSLTATLNPAPGPVEVTLVNNSINQPMNVRGDTRHPLLDVTFDGRYIGSGDIVSPQPEIVIQLRDDNPIRALNDTLGLRVRLKDIARSNPVEPARDLWYSLSTGAPNPELEFIPAPGGGANNRARVIYRPTRYEDGEYELVVVGTDRAGNQAGLEPYKLRFRVVNASTLTHVVNYPNPFSTSTRFVYTLTGAEIPEVFQVHIYTVTGRLVKVIDLKAAGDIRIGTNLSEASWDGTDEYGDRLGNGVYLYRTILEMPNGVEAPKLNDSANPDAGFSGTGQFFKGGWGKMYLMR